MNRAREAVASGGRAGSSPAPLLCAEAVHKHFGGIIALRGVMLTVDSGEIVGLIGPNGTARPGEDIPNDELLPRVHGAR